MSQIKLFELDDVAPAAERDDGAGRKRARKRAAPVTEQPALPGLQIVVREAVMKQRERQGDLIPSGPEIFPGENAARAIIKVLERLRHRTGMYGTELFERWVDCCHLALDRMPSLLVQVTAGIEIVDTPGQAEAWQKAVAGLDAETVQGFSEGLAILIAASSDGGKPTYADVVGQVFEQAVQWKGRRQQLGQFFTPYPVARFMAEAVGGTRDFEKELEAKFREMCDDPWFFAQALTLMICEDGPGMEQAAWEMRAEMMSKLVAEKGPVVVMDPCVGSGVMLLQAAASAPRWMIDAGLLQFYGCDIDPCCAKMAQLNLRLYGLNQTWGPAAKAWFSCEARELMPWPWQELYTYALLDVEPGREFWEEGIAYARAGRFDEWPGVSVFEECREEVEIGRQ